jgi:hypothetical protein
MASARGGPKRADGLTLHMTMTQRNALSEGKIRQPAAVVPQGRIGKIEKEDKGRA